VNVVDDEVSESQSRAVVHRLVPSPASPFIEHDVPRDANALCHRVKDAIGLDALRVADEDSRRALVVELADMVELLGKGKTVEDAEVAHHRLAPVLGLVQRLVIKGLGGRAVEEMDGSHHRLPLVDCWHSSLLEEGAGGSHHCLVAVLNDASLLWGVRRGEVVLDSLVGAVCRELSCREVAAIVGA
jgi:hypothetical protein